jgi:hypothetical protein
MTLTETRFAYKYKPTNQWVCIDAIFGKDIEMHLLDEFSPDITYKARNIIEEDLLKSYFHGKRFAIINFNEFKLVEIEIKYRIKNDRSLPKSNKKRKVGQRRS